MNQAFILNTFITLEEKYKFIKIQVNLTLIFFFGWQRCVRLQQEGNVDWCKKSFTLGLKHMLSGYLIITANYINYNNKNPTTLNCYVSETSDFSEFGADSQYIVFVKQLCQHFDDWEVLKQL